MIPIYLTEPWPEAHPDRERVRKAAVDGYSTQDTSALTEAFRGLPDGEKHNAWEYLTTEGLGHHEVYIEFARFVHRAVSADLLELHGIPKEDKGQPVVPVFKMPFVRAPRWARET